MNLDSKAGMLGFFKKRIWKEQVKLAAQNSLACRYLVDFEESSIEAGLKSPSPFPSVFETELETSNGHLATLRSGEPLPSLIGSDALKMNRDLRNAYGEILTARRAFASRFGSASERLLPFDQMFTPKEGWATYLDHFLEPPSVQRQGGPNAAQDHSAAIPDSLPQRTFEELVSLGQELAREDAEQNLRVRMQQHQARRAKDRAGALGSDEGKNGDRDLPGGRPAQPAWEMTERLCQIISA